MSSADNRLSSPLSPNEKGKSRRGASGVGAERWDADRSPSPNIGTSSPTEHVDCSPAERAAQLSDGIAIADEEKAELCELIGSLCPSGTPICWTSRSACCSRPSPSPRCPSVHNGAAIVVHLADAADGICNRNLSGLCRSDQEASARRSSWVLWDADEAPLRKQQCGPISGGNQNSAATNLNWSRGSGGNVDTIWLEQFWIHYQNVPTCEYQLQLFSLLSWAQPFFVQGLKHMIN